jgi:hypothetical protein
MKRGLGDDKKYKEIKFEGVEWVDSYRTRITFIKDGKYVGGLSD